MANGTVLPTTIVVVDQSARDDRTRAVVLAADRSTPDACSIRHHRSSGGMARGQNDGFAVIDEPIVLVTDDDCVPTPDWVETACDVLTEDGELGLVGGRVLPLGPATPGFEAVASRTSDVPLELDHGTDPWTVGSGNNFAVRRAAFLAIGGNDERLGPGAKFRGGADMDLFRRLLRAGVRGRYDPQLTVHHERATRAGRRARRVPYGYGMGIACTLWWRQGDSEARAIAGRYLAMRLRRARRAARAADPDGVFDEILVLVGMLRGLARGFAIIDPVPLQRGGAR